MTEQEDITFNSTADFGFTFESEADEKLLNEQHKILEDSYIALQNEKEKIEQTNREIMKRITLLLNSLKQEPEKEVIRWPDRVNNIDNFLKELNKLYKNGVKE